MASRTPWPGTVVDGEIANDDDFNSGPGGWLGYIETTTDTTGVTGTITDMTGLSITVTVPANRIVTVVGYVPRIASDTANDACEVSIRESTTSLQTAFIDLSARTIGGSGGNPARVETAPFTPSAGSHTYKLSMIRATGGSGVLESVLDADAIGWIGVFDWGSST